MLSRLARSLRKGGSGRPRAFPLSELLSYARSRDSRRRSSDDDIFDSIFEKLVNGILQVHVRLVMASLVSKIENHRWP